MDNIESSIRDLYEQLQSKASVLHPAIFPSQFIARSIFDMFSSESQQEIARTYLLKQGFDDYCTFETSIDYHNRKIKVGRLRKGEAIDQKIHSLEYMMRAFVLGSKEEIDLLTHRFLEVNGHHYITSKTDASELLQEVCNIAYAIKVTLSNTPGMKIYLGDRVLPLQLADAHNEIYDIIDSLVRKDTQDTGEDSDDELRETNGAKTDAENLKKNKRKKRGKGIKC